MKEDRGASSRGAVFVKADVQAVLILILVINDVLAVFHIKIRIVFDVYHLIVMHAFILVARPVGVVVNLCVRNRASRICCDTESFVEAVNTDRSLAASFFVLFVEAQSVFTHKARGREDLFPVAIFISLMHGYGRRGGLHGNACNHKKLVYILILRLRECSDPFGRIDFVLNGSMKDVLGLLQKNAVYRRGILGCFGFGCFFGISCL